MAAIDKIYVSSYDEYAQVRDFFLAHEFTTRDGNRIKLRNYLYYNDTIGTEEERKSIREWYSDGKEHPVTNTPAYVDEYLLKNCDLTIVQDYLHDVYDNPEVDLVPAEKPEPAKKVVVVKKGNFAANYPAPFYNSNTNRKVRGYHIDIRNKEGYDFWWYNEKRDKWYRNGDLEPWTCSAAYIYNRSMKSVIRKILKKWKLPAGLRITVSGRFVGDEYILETK